jgi:hypothetical protein
MDDEPESMRLVIARAFGLIGAITHAKDPRDVREIAADHAHWILTGEEPPEIFDPSTLAMLQGYCMKWRARRRPGK